MLKSRQELKRIKIYIKYTIKLLSPFVGKNVYILMKLILDTVDLDIDYSLFGYKLNLVEMIYAQLENKSMTNEPMVYKTLKQIINNIICLLHKYPLYKKKKLKLAGFYVIYTV